MEDAANLRRCIGRRVFQRCRPTRAELRPRAEWTPPHPCAVVVPHSVERDRGHDRMRRRSERLKDLPGRVAPVNGDDTATRMRGRTAEIRAKHRSARQQAVRPHIQRHTFAVKDVSAMCGEMRTVLLCQQLAIRQLQPGKAPSPQVAKLSSCSNPSFYSSPLCQYHLVPYSQA